MNIQEPLNPRPISDPATPAVPPIRVPLRPVGVAPVWLRTVQANAAKLTSARPQFVMQASPASRSVPYSEGLDYGVGIDSPSGTALNVAVTGDPSQIPNAGGQVFDYTMNELTSEEDLQTALSISVEANGGIGVFSASARMDYAKSCQMNSSSVFLLVRIQVTNAFTMITQPGISPAAATLLANGNVTAFQQQYGDMFVRGLQTGGCFYGVIEIETKSETDKETVSASVSAAYGLFGGSGDFSSSFTQTVSNRSLKVTCYIEGGTIPDPVPTTVEALMSAASAWPQTVANKAVPYTALLDGYGVLSLPSPPNYIGLQQEQDVLSQCSLWRNQDLMTLNDIAYINTYPSQFVNPNAAQLEQWQNDISQDLNTIAAAASYALNNPGKAEFPTLQLPPPVQLPQRVAGAAAPVTVPNLDGMFIDNAVNLLTSLGLKPSGVVVETTQVDEGHIFNQSPPAGTLVPAGSTVVVQWAKLEIKL